MEFRYYLSRQFIDAQFIETGINLSKEQCIEVDDLEAGKELRQLYIELKEGAVTWLPDQSKILLAEEACQVMAVMKFDRDIEKFKAKEALDTLIEEAQSINLGTQLSGNDYLRRCQNFCNKAQLPASYIDGVREKIDADRADYLSREEQRKKAAAEENDAAINRALTEKAEWIQAHGSDHLKRAFAREFDCDRQYVQERAEIEYPGFLLDWRDAAKWNIDCFPSEAALDELDKLPGEFSVARLIQRHDCDPESDLFAKYATLKEKEVIYLREYLGFSVDLVKYI